jgi:hypothetical protein
MLTLTLCCHAVPYASRLLVSALCVRIQRGDGRRAGMPVTSPNALRVPLPNAPLRSEALTMALGARALRHVGTSAVVSAAVQLVESALTLAGPSEETKID